MAPNYQEDYRDFDARNNYSQHQHGRTYANSRRYHQGSEQDQYRPESYNSGQDADRGRHHSSDDYNSYHLYRRDHSQRGNTQHSGTGFGTHARGDYSGGTRYGEGGSTYGGGSAYGHSDYGPNQYQDSRRHNRHEGRRYAENVQNGYVDFTDYDSRNYGSYGGAQTYGSGANTGYNRGNANFNDTGYGTTRFNNRDQDRERSAWGSNNGNRNDEYIRERYREDYNREL